MVDQAQITCRTPATSDRAGMSDRPMTSDRPTNGRSNELPPRAVARSTAEFLHDITTLAELQGKLLVIDLQEGVKKLVISTILLVLGTIIALGTVPIALATVAFLITYFTELPLVCTFGIALLVGLVLAAALAIPALFALKKNVWMFDRSRDEWIRNMQWAKEAMRRMSGRESTSPAASGRW